MAIGILGASGQKLPFFWSERGREAQAFQLNTTPQRPLDATQHSIFHEPSKPWVNRSTTPLQELHPRIGSHLEVRPPAAENEFHRFHDVLPVAWSKMHSNPKPRARKESFHRPRPPSMHSIFLVAWNSFTCASWSWLACAAWPRAALSGQVCLMSDFREWVTRGFFNGGPIWGAMLSQRPGFVPV